MVRGWSLVFGRSFAMFRFGPFQLLGSSLRLQKYTAYQKTAIPWSLVSSLPYILSRHLILYVRRPLPRAKLFS